MIKLWTLLLFCATVTPGAPSRANDATAPYKNAAVPTEDRVSDLLSRLTLEEKANLCHGAFLSGGVPRLEIPQLAMLDGRQGLRPVGDNKGTRTTSLPSVLALSCTWDEAAAKDFGRVLAEEMLALNHHVLLAPMLNLIRSPLGGRNFENFGEDPLVVGRLGSAYIQGVQQQRVGACSCLLVANDNEHRRHFTSSNMDERTLRELHLLGYELSVRDGKVWSMMSGNNLFNGVYCAQNRPLIQELVKDEIGFDGVMITDWRAAYETVPTALAGTDMATGHCSYVFGEGRLLAAVNAGEVPKELLDEKVRRILRLYVRSGVLDLGSRAKGGIDTPDHRAVARRIAAEGMVLLKNDNRALPLDTSKLKRILITGPAADIVFQGGGSGHVPAAFEITPLQGLRNAVTTASEITHLPYRVPLQPGMHQGAVEWVQPAAGKRRRWNKGPETSTSEIDIPTSSALAEAAKAADVVIFVAAGLQASEGRDLPDISLPANQGQAIETLLQANKNVIVVLVNNGALSLGNWGEKIPAILAMHYSGQATGNALADVLTGKFNPGGKLTYTFAKRLEDYPVHAVGEWPPKLILEKDPVDPGMKPADRKPMHAFTTQYKEGVFAGYRWFDKHDTEPWFPFGHGLSYTTFEITDLSAATSGTEIQVSCTVKNTGSRAGAEVVQVYVSPGQTSVERPEQELKGFAKVKLQPGESRQVHIPLRESATAFYDPAAKMWKTEKGTYEIRVGNSSRNISLKSPLIVSADKYHVHY